MTHDCDLVAECTNTLGSFSCSCEAGFAGNGTYCADVDECSTEKAIDMLHDCAQEAECTNTQGSFNCTCKIGYFGNGTHCAGNSIADLLQQIMKSHVFQM